MGCGCVDVGGLPPDDEMNHCVGLTAGSGSAGRADNSCCVRRLSSPLHYNNRTIVPTFAPLWRKQAIKRRTRLASPGAVQTLLHSLIDAIVASASVIHHRVCQQPNAVAFTSTRPSEIFFQRCCRSLYYCKEDDPAPRRAIRFIGLSPLGYSSRFLISISQKFWGICFSVASVRVT
ncbi:hypothetical protein BJV74DRAFT_245117 [Russula compacta]|nr:hypothetical protein BJV74DRAFT_245117 [Russula compacta]